LGDTAQEKVESSWNMMVHGDAREGRWRGDWRMEWVASTLHTTSEHALSSITTSDAHTSAASSRLNWRPRRFKWTRPFRRKTKSGFCACASTFQTRSTATSASSLWYSKTLSAWQSPYVSQLNQCFVYRLCVHHQGLVITQYPTYHKLHSLTTTQFRRCKCL
jgi:hypothetical protein